MGQFYWQEYKDASFKLLPGVQELLVALLRRGIMCGLVTGAIDQIGRFKLRKTGLVRYFPIQHFGNETLTRADLVRKALKRNALNHWAPFGNIVLFGDTKRDVEAGKSAGIRTVGVATGRFSKDQLKEVSPDFVLDDLTDTKAILKIFGVAL